MNWPLVKLGDVATLINGRAYKKTELLDSGPTPVLRVGNFFSNRSWYYSDLTLSEDKYCNEGDLLFAWSASFGPKIWDGPRAIYHYHIWKIVVSPAIDKNYLYHLLDSISAEIKSQGNGITMVHATKGGMEKREIPLPPLPEQRKIATILDAADQLRQKDQQLIEHYARLGQALFLEMFGDPVGNPMGWETQTIEHLAIKKRGAIKRGPFGGALKKEIFVDDGYLVYEQYHALNNDFSMARYFITEEKFEELRGFEVHTGDLIISCSGVNLGKLAIVPENAREGIINQALLKVSLNCEVMNNLIFVFIFTNKNFKEKFFGDQRGSGVPNFPPMSVFKKFAFICPPIELQNQFAQHIEAIEQQKQSAQASLEKSEVLFNSLLQRAFKGELTGKC